MIPESSKIVRWLILRDAHRFFNYAAMTSQFFFVYLQNLGLVSLFNGTSTFVGHLIPKQSLKRTVVILVKSLLMGKGDSHCLTHSWKDKDWFDVISLFNDVSNIEGYSMSKQSV